MVAGKFFFFFLPYEFLRSLSSITTPYYAFLQRHPENRPRPPNYRGDWRAVRHLCCAHPGSPGYHFQAFTSMRLLAQIHKCAESTRLMNFPSWADLCGILGTSSGGIAIGRDGALHSRDQEENHQKGARHKSDGD